MRQRLDLPHALAAIAFEGLVTVPVHGGQFNLDMCLLRCDHATEKRDAFFCIQTDSSTQRGL